jgi:hypothetical protein
MRGSNDRLCKIIQSKTSLLGVAYEDEISRSLNIYEENGESGTSPSPFAGHLQTLLVQFERKFQEFTIID